MCKLNLKFNLKFFTKLARQDWIRGLIIHQDQIIVGSSPSTISINPDFDYYIV